MQKHAFLLLFLLVIVFGTGLASNAIGSDNMMGPWESSSPAPKNQPLSSSQIFGRGLIRVYQETWSRTGAGNSPSFPSSSRYMYQAIERFGLWQGIFMGVDRLIHEVDHSDNPVRIYRNQRWFIYDPIERNILTP